MRKIVKMLVVSMLMVLMLGTISVSAQITEEKDIPKGYTPIYTIEDLYGINDNLKGNYILMADIDMSETKPGGDWDFGYGWKPIGYESNNSKAKCFTGIFDGNGHKILNMNIYGDVPYQYIGLFSYIQFESKTCFRNLGMENVSINIVGNEKKCVGSLVGFVDTYMSWIGDVESIKECYVTGEIICGKADRVGGIAGRCNRSYFSVLDCYSNVDIDSENAGGLLGSIGQDQHNSIEFCYSYGDVEGNESKTVVSSIGSLPEKKYIYGDVSENSNTFVTKLNKAQKKIKSCYTGFDFDKVWFMDKNSSYPYPQLINCPQVRVQEISIQSVPKKLTYGIGDKLNLEGSKVKILYDDGYTVTVPIEEGMCKYSMEKGSQTVTVEYFGQSDEFEIKVGAEKEVLYVTAEVSKLEVGDSFKFKAKYNGAEPIIFSSSDNGILSINKKTGKAKAKKAGNVVVTVSAGTLSEKIKVKVTK